MKNKKGFTIIELLITIALIASVSVAIGVNVINMQERQKEKEIQDFKEKLERTACTYADVMGIDAESGIDSISTCNLIKDGYLKKISIPGTDYKLGDQRNLNISISWNNNEKICTYDTTQTPNSVLTCEDLVSDKYIYEQGSDVAICGSSDNLNNGRPCDLDEYQSVYNHPIVYFNDINAIFDEGNLLVIKHKIDKNNRILESYICVNVNNKTYCFQGGNSGRSYNHNVNVLESIEWDNCDEHNNDGIIVKSCSKDTLNVSISENGVVSAYQSGWSSCVIEEGSYSWCD